MWRLLRNTIPSSCQSGDGLETKRNLVVGPDGVRNQERLYCRGPVASSLLFPWLSADQEQMNFNSHSSLHCVLALLVCLCENCAQMQQRWRSTPFLCCITRRHSASHRITSSTSQRFSFSTLNLHCLGTWSEIFCHNLLSFSLEY
jgi:hypothetical protein